MLYTMYMHMYTIYHLNIRNMIHFKSSEKSFNILCFVLLVTSIKLFLSAVIGQCLIKIKVLNYQCLYFDTLLKVAHVCI